MCVCVCVCMCVCTCVKLLCILLHSFGLGVRVFANRPGDLVSIAGRVIPKTQKMVLDASLLNTQHYKVRIKGKVEQSREGVAPSPTPWCSSYRKGSLRVTLDYGRQLYLLIYPNISLRSRSQHVGSSVSSTKKDIDTRLGKAIDHMEIRPDR